MAKQGLMYLLLLFALVVVANSQAYPRFEFGSRVLPNNSYIFCGDIGEGVNNSLRCVTDYSNEDFSDGSESGMGNWYDEKGMEVHQGAGGDSDLYVTRGDGVVYLNRRNMRGGQSGMWRCDIPDRTGTTQSIYIYTGTRMTGTM